MQRLTTISSIAALTMLYAASGAAYAGDSYGPTIIGVAGSMCQPSHGDQWGDFDINPNGLRNTTNQNRFVSCTMVANNPTNIDQSDSDSTTKNGGFRFLVYLDYSQVPAMTITYNTTCTVFARNMLTGVESSESFVVGSTRTTTPVTKSLDPASFDGYSANLYAAYSFNCRLPPKVKLMGFSQATFGSVGGYDYTP